jgi:hypothetical protein
MMMLLIKECDDSHQAQRMLASRSPRDVGVAQLKIFFLLRRFSRSYENTVRRAPRAIPDPAHSKVKWLGFTRSRLTPISNSGSQTAH